LIDSGSPTRTGEETIMKDVSRVRVVGPLAALAEGFRQELEERGYSPLTALSYLQLMCHLSGWLGVRRGVVLPLTALGVDSYLRGRREAGYRSFLTVRAVCPLVDYLRRQGLVQEAGEEDGATLGATDGLLIRFAEYLRVERGLAEVTIERRVFLARRILSAWELGSPADLRDLTAGEVTAFVVDSSRTDNGSVSGVVTALRSLLRFLHLAGVIDRPLAAAVPRLASWKLAGLPKAVPVEQVSALLASCDRDSVVGRRDAAIVTVLARLGLRAGEVACLRLDDMDWRSGEITVRGKGNRSERLPLPFDVGEVLVAYLTAGHPGAAAARNRVFARVRAPRGPLTRGAVTQVVARAAQRAGFEPFYAHRLRHTAATEMLRGGGSLEEIGQVLRHHHRATTAIYAKVDIEALRTVARPWPGTRS
jgi:integrase/recombinase XerD